MVEIDIQFNEKLVDSSFHGAFKSFRSASNWLIEEGYEAFFDDDLSELLKDEIISFVYKDKENNEEFSARIRTFSIQD